MLGPPHVSPSLQTQGLGGRIPAKAAHSHCPKSGGLTLTLTCHKLSLRRHVRNAWKLPARRDLSFPPLKCPLNAVLNDRSSLPFSRKCFAMPLSIPQTHSLRSTICVDQREFNQPTIINWVILNCTKPPVR